MHLRGLWLSLILVIVASFAVLGYYGREIYREAPPIPDRVVVTDGTVVFTGEQIRTGQNVWQTMGGQEIGSIWGHGAYVAPDWSADWLHREAVWLLDYEAGRRGAADYAALDPERQAALRAWLQRELRTNTYAAGTVTITPAQAAAITEVADHYHRLFGADAGLDKLRAAYALPANTVADPSQQQALAAFFWWTAWACVTERPGSAVTYTQNWPADELVGNRPTGSIVVWSVVSFVLLLAGVGALAWYLAASRREDAEEAYPEADPLLALQPTPSMRATVPYFWIAGALLVVQILLGVVAAHYGVEGSGFYGFPLADWLPYSVARTWHLQLGIFWIATAWLGTGLFIAPAVAGREPPGQRAGVWILLGALVVVVVGSLAGEWLAAKNHLTLPVAFWFGHQGYEYVDLGRAWQIALLVGLLLWFFLLIRALAPAFRAPVANRHLLGLFAIASAAIALFYAAGLMWGRQTNLAVVEYWRWWVVHLWVEGFFEVFATVVIAFLFTRMGLLRTAAASGAVLFSTIIFLAGGILGTFHHLYFTGTPTGVLALGATFSALEVVPLVLIGFEGYENYRLGRARPWVQGYRWPIAFFISVAFWNLVGAGLFGFFINPPIALYYMQGLNTTPLHGHTALFGVYGMLGIGLMLFCLKGLSAQSRWRTCWIAVAFWCINGGLALMALLSLLPVGILQTLASVEHGMWYARSAEFMQGGSIEVFRWLRVVGDTVFAVGVLALAWFVIGLKTGWSIAGGDDRPTVPAPPASP